jgi:hypothetical protein
MECAGGDRGTAETGGRYCVFSTGDTGTVLCLPGADSGRQGKGRRHGDGTVSSARVLGGDTGMQTGGRQADRGTVLCLQHGFSTVEKVARA